MNAPPNGPLQMKPKLVIADRINCPSYWQPVPANGYIDVLLDPTQTHSGRVAMGTQTVAPGSFVREHAHPEQEELIFMIEGEGIAIVEDREYPMHPGALVYVGPYARHKLVNTGTGDLTFTWTMVPAGLEKFFSAIGQPCRAGDPAPAPFPRPSDIQQIELDTVFVDLNK